MAKAAGGAAGPAYFVQSKKGEVNELQQLLRNLKVQRDPVRKREVVKKVIAYMTLGIDVSRLFGDMVMVRTRVCADRSRHAPWHVLPPPSTPLSPPPPLAHTSFHATLVLVLLH